MNAAAYGRYRAMYGMLVVSLGSLMGPLDAAVNVAFPVITRHFELRISDIQWIIIVYVLAQSCFTIVFGRLGDLYGHRRIFMIGAAGCAIVHLLAGFAPTYGALVALRMLQGIAIGIALSCGPAIVTFLYPPAQKRYALGLFTMLFGLGLAIGPVAGGLLLEHYGWPAVFWYRVPLAVAALVLAIWLPLPHAPGKQKPHFDILGAFYLVVVLGSFVALISMTRQSASALAPLALLVIWALATWIFVRHENAVAQPVIQVSHYANPLFAGIQLTTIAVNFFLFVIFLMLPYLLSARGDITLIGSGLIIAIYPCGTITGGLLGGRLSRAVSSISLVRISMIVMSAGLLLIGLTGPLPSILPFLVFLFLTGLGLGLFQVGNLDLTTSILSENDRGVAGSLVNVGRLLGIVIGAATITWLFDVLNTGDELVAFRQTYVLLGVALVLFGVLMDVLVFRKVARRARGEV